MKLLIDLDGTVLDCRSRLHRLFCALAPEAAMPFADYWTLKRAPRSNASILHDLAGWSDEQTSDFERRWLEEVERDEYLQFDQPFAHTERALELLSGRGSLMLLTSRQFEDRARRQIESHRLDRYFEDVIVATSGGDKAGAVRARRLDLASDDLLVGDTEADIRAARELGITAVALEGGVRDGEFLLKCKPDYIYSDLLDFAENHFRAIGRTSSGGGTAE